MKEITLGLTNYFEGFLLFVCIIAVPYYLYQAYRKFKDDRIIKVNGAGGSLFLAFVFFALLKINLTAQPGLVPYVYDGERGVYTVPNLFWMNDKIELELRSDPESGLMLWMAEDQHGYYPFFVEPARTPY